MLEHASHSILRRTTYVSLGTLAARLLNAVTGILIARAVGPAAFGVYAAVWALVELSTSITEIGLITGLKRDGGHHPERLPYLLGNTLAARTAAGLVVLAGAALMRGVLVRNPDAARIFVPLGLTALSIIVTDSFFAVLQIKGQQRAAAGFVVLRALIFFVGTAAIDWMRGGLAAFACYQGVVYALCALAVAAYVWSTIPWTLRLGRLPRQMQGSLPFAISEILYGVYMSLPLLALSRLASEEATGYYSVAQRFVTLGIAVGISATHEAFLPALFRLHRASREEFRAVATASQRLMFAAGLLGACLLFVFAEPLILWLQGEAYRPSILLLRISCWYALLVYATLTADNALTAGERVGVKIRIQAVVALATLCAALALIPRFGAVGASLAALTGASINLVLQCVCAIKAGLLPVAGQGGLLVRGVATAVVAVLAVYGAGAWPWLGPALFLAGAGLMWGAFLRKAMQHPAEPH